MYKTFYTHTHIYIWQNKKSDSSLKVVGEQKFMKNSHAIWKVTDIGKIKDVSIHLVSIHYYQ